MPPYLHCRVLTNRQYRTTEATAGPDKDQLWLLLFSNIIKHLHASNIHVKVQEMGYRTCLQ